MPLHPDYRFTSLRARAKQSRLYCPFILATSPDASLIEQQKGNASPSRLQIHVFASESEAIQVVLPLHPCHITGCFTYRAAKRKCLSIRATDSRLCERERSNPGCIAPSSLPHHR